MKPVHITASALAVTIVLGTTVAMYPRMAKAATNNPANLSGSGTAASPYLIKSLADLQAFDTNWSQYAGDVLQLTADITLPAPAQAGIPGSSNWTPVGTQAAPFTGTFNGNGHTITGLNIDNAFPINLSTADVTPVGLFGAVSGTVENLTLASVNLVNNDPMEPTGAMVGLLGSVSGSGATPTLSNDSVTSGTVTSDGNSDTSQSGWQQSYQFGVGGLLGSNGASAGSSGGWIGGTVIDSSASDTVQSVSKSVSGVTGGQETAVGGLVGANNYLGQVEDSYATGSASGYFGGGLIGSNNGGIVQDDYADAKVSTPLFDKGDPSGFASVGGLIGYDFGQINESVTNTYAVGPVDGTNSDNQGGLVGLEGSSGAAVSADYFDTNTTGQTSSGGYGTGESDAAMKQMSTFSSVSLSDTRTGFNFSTTWSIPTHGETSYPYPFLQHNFGFASPFAGGDGSVLYPYLISNAAQLADMSDFLGESFSLQSDLTPTGDWQPVGDLLAPFVGTFNGNDHTITGLTINVPAPTTPSSIDSAPVGMFGAVNGTIKNVTLSSVNVTNNDPSEPAGAVVGLLGKLSGSSATPTVSNVVVTSGSVTSDGNPTTNSSLSAIEAYGVGGLVGNNGTYTGKFSWIGTTISNSSASDNVQSKMESENGWSGGGATPAGGLVGVTYLGSSNTETRVVDSFATGDVSGSAVSGGLIGLNDGTVQDSYAVGNVGVANGAQNILDVGGLIGWDLGNAPVTNTFAVGHVDGTKASNLGGLEGQNSLNDASNIASSYFDTTTTGQSGSIGTPEPDSAMKQQATYSGWDFTSTWGIASNFNHAYPYLQALTPAGPTGVKVTPGQTTASISFQPVSGATSYTATVKDGSGNTVGSAITQTSSPITVTGLTTGSNYTVTLVGSTARGLSLPSSQSFTTEPYGSAPAPQGLQASNITTGGWVETWTPVSSASGYDIYLNGQQVGSTVQNVYTYTFSGLQPGTNYSVQIASKDGTGLQSQLSAVDSVTTAAVYGNGGGGGGVPTPPVPPSLPSIVTTMLPPGTIGRLYSGALTTIGGVSPYTWGLTKGVLPAGLNLDAQSGTLSGTPTPSHSGVTSLTFTVTDANGNTSAQTVLLDILEPYEREIIWRGHIKNVPAVVGDDSGTQTTYMPIWYVMQLLKPLGIESTWNGHDWYMTTSTPPDLSDIQAGTGSTNIYLNGTLVQKVNTEAQVDPSTQNPTTYMPIWYVQQILNRVGLHSTWNGTTWTVTQTNS